MLVCSLCLKRRFLFLLVTIFFSFSIFIQALKEMRNNKSSKHNDESEESSDGGDSSSSKSEVKFECEICSGSFHPSHVPLPKCKTSQPTSLHDIKFLCPSCLRSRRPRIELILSLLMNYEKISVKLPEGKFRFLRNKREKSIIQIESNRLKLTTTT